jgi:hypothetical protein
MRSPRIGVLSHYSPSCVRPAGDSLRAGACARQRVNAAGVSSLTAARVLSRLSGPVSLAMAPVSGGKAARPGLRDAPGRPLRAPFPCRLQSLSQRRTAIPPSLNSDGPLAGFSWWCHLRLESRSIKPPVTGVPPHHLHRPEPADATRSRGRLRSSHDGSGRYRRWDGGCSSGLGADTRRLTGFTARRDSPTRRERAFHVLRPRAEPSRERDHHRSGPRSLGTHRRWAGSP